MRSRATRADLLVEPYRERGDRYCGGQLEHRDGVSHPWKHPSGDGGSFSPEELLVAPVRVDNALALRRLHATPPVNTATEDAPTLKPTVALRALPNLAPAKPSSKRHRGLLAGLDVSVRATAS
jgi:hypothetical protein